MQFNQASSEGIYLRFPENIQPQRELSYEAAITFLLRGTAMSQNVPFVWAYIDKPADGSIYLLYHPPNVPYSIDGIRFQENEVKYTIPAGTRELEISESKFGFIPNSTDANASRVRRRYRLTKGGNPQLMLVHYTRGAPTHIQPALMNQPTRLNPLRPINEPAMYVAGEKMGQKVYPQGSQPAPGPTMGMPFGQQQAMLAQQNSNMEALERRRERERAQERTGPRSDAPGGRPPPPQRIEEDDSGDEVDQISSRTLALARYKRNHDWMNDVFNQAAFGKRTEPPRPSPYSIFSKSEIEAKTEKLRAELEVLQTKAAQRRADSIRATQGGENASIGEAVAI